MLYTTIKIGDKEYKGRLNARALVQIEDTLGINPLNALMAISQDNLPSVKVMLAFLHAALQSYEHGITLDKTYDLYDAYLEAGGDYASFVEEVFIPLITEGGLLPKEVEEGKNAKKEK